MRAWHLCYKTHVSQLLVQEPCCRFGGRPSTTNQGRLFPEWLACSCLEAGEYTSLALNIYLFVTGIPITLCLCLCNKPKGLDVRRSEHLPRHRRPCCVAKTSFHQCQPLVRNSSCTRTSCSLFALDPRAPCSDFATVTNARHACSGCADGAGHAGSARA